MVRVALLLVCVFATYVVQPAAGGTAPASLFQSPKIYTGTATVSKLGDSSSCPTGPYSTYDAANRERTVKVYFNEPFTSVPGVTYSITELDANKSHNLRYNIKIVEVTKTGFTLTFKTWCDTYIHYMTVTFWVFGVSMSGGVTVAST